MTDRSEVVALVLAIRRALQSESAGYPGQLEGFTVKSIHEFAEKLVRVGVTIRDTREVA